MGERMKALLYPYTFRNQFLLESTRGLVITGIFDWQKKFARRNMETGHEVCVFATTDVSGYLEQCEGIIFYPDEYVSDQFRRVLLDNIRICLEGGRQAFCVMELEEKEIQNFRGLAAEKGTVFRYLMDEGWEKPAITGVDFRECDCPVIYIGQLCENTYAKDLTVGLTNAFCGQGYKVCTVLDDPCAAVMEMERTPPFIRAVAKESDKMFWLNRFIKGLEEEKKPQVIIVQVPGNIFPLSANIYSDFNIYQIYYAYACRPDVFFCTIPAEGIEEEGIERMNQRLVTQYGYGFDGIWQTDYTVDWHSVTDAGEVNGRVLRSDKAVRFFSEKTGADQINVVHGMKREVFERFFAIAEELLSEEQIQIM